MSSSFFIAHSPISTTPPSTPAKKATKAAAPMAAPTPQSLACVRIIAKANSPKTMMPIT